MIALKQSRAFNPDSVTALVLLWVLEQLGGRPGLALLAPADNHSPGVVSAPRRHLRVALPRSIEQRATLNFFPAISGGFSSPSVLITILRVTFSAQDFHSMMHFF